MFTLSSMSSGLEFSSVNHTSVYENSKLHVFENKSLWVKCLVIEKTIYWEQRYTELSIIENSLYSHWIILI